MIFCYTSMNIGTNKHSDFDLIFLDTRGFHKKNYMEY